MMLVIQRLVGLKLIPLMILILHILKILTSFDLLVVFLDKSENNQNDEDKNSFNSDLCMTTAMHSI